MSTTNKTIDQIDEQLAEIEAQTSPLFEALNRSRLKREDRHRLGELLAEEDRLKLQRHRLLMDAWREARA